jgi:hypothetical protein
METRFNWRADAREALPFTNIEDSITFLNKPKK